MRTLLASLRPLRTELLGVAGLTALLLLAAGGIAARLLTYGIPAECFELVNGESTCPTYLHAVYEYQSFAGNFGGSIAVFATMLPAIAGVILGIAAVAKELDQRTAVLAWSVDASRRHWLLQRVIPLLGVIVVLGLGSPQLVAALMRLASPGQDLVAVQDFDSMAEVGLSPLAAGVSAFGISIVIGAMLGRLLPGLLAAAAFIVFASLLIQQGNGRLMSGESLVAEIGQAGPGHQLDSVLRTPDGRVIGWGEAFPDYADINTGLLLPGVTEMVRYVPIEIYPQVAARYVLFHLLVGFVALTLAFAVVERRSP